MRLSRKSEYSCLALIHLSRQAGAGLVKLDAIASAEGIPREYLVQLMHTLKRAGYIQAARGASGGYRLAKRPEQITLAEIIRLMDGPLAPVDSVSRYFYSHTPIESCPGLVDVFRDIRDYIAAKLESTTFADLAGGKAC
ncbi:MAG: Rrf2 family transcriptional regulator [Planctomycetes bacterium]|nr:Rrf2 family transcriptional regulator [Planctomycetota bacterium]